MYCGSCGRNIPNGSRVCNYCGQPQMGGAYQAYPRRGIDNIFSALVHERTTGVIMEFVLWCVTCVIAVMAMIASIVGHGHLTWIFLMLFAIGLGVLTAFRLKPIALLYSVGVFDLIVCAIHYGLLRGSGRSSDIGDYYDYSYSYSVFNLILFIVIMLLTVAIVTCAFIHFFSRIELGNVMTIMLCVDTGLLLFLHIMMYAMPYTGAWADAMNESLRSGLNYIGYWFGTIVLWMMLIVVLLYYIFFFWGAMDNSKGKILSSLNGGYVAQRRISPGRGASQQVNPGMQGISGQYTGQVIYLQGRTVTIGSGPKVMIMISAPYVSGEHCAIRFNNLNGYYEIWDNSKNGVTLSSGKMLQKGVYNAVQRGEIISIGSNEQRFRLL